MTDWKTKLAGKRLIFTVTSGRSGTHFLTRLFHYLPGMDVFHEETGHSYHTVLRANQLDSSVGRRFLEEQKLPFIAACSQPVFVETSHLICKGFLEHFLDLGLVPDLVLLSRTRRKIAVSLYRLGTIPGRNDKALQFYLTPDDPNVMTAADWHRWSDYQLCYWYVMEIERRQRIYGERILSLGGRVHACDLDHLATRGGYCEMIRHLGLRGPSLVNWLKFFRSRNRKAGDFSAMKNQRTLPDDIEKEELSIESLFGGNGH